MEDMEELGEPGAGFVKFLPLPFTRHGAGKVGIYVCLFALHFFMKLDRNGDFLWHYVCVR